MPSIASFVYSTLGRAYRNLGDFHKAIEYHTLDLAIAKEVGDRAGEGRAYGNLGNAYRSQGDFSKAIEYHARNLAIAKRRSATGRARAVRAGTLGARISRRGTSARPSNTTRSAWRSQRRWATGHADAHVQRLLCSEVLQRRSPKDGFEKNCIGQESDDGAAQGYLRSAPQVARCGQRRRVAWLRAR